MQLDLKRRDFITLLGGAVWEFVHAERLSLKKSVVAGERDRPDVARRRAQWIRYQDRVQPERLVFIDETWTKTNVAPLRGWAPCRRRLLAKVPHRHWKTTTFRCDTIGSRRHGFLRAQSMARAFEFMSRRYSCPLFGRATSSSWTISAVTRATLMLIVGQSSRPPHAQNGLYALTLHL
jgi:hypothetical protein